MHSVLKILSSVVLFLIIPTYGYCDEQIVEIVIQDHKFIPDTIYLKPNKKIKIIIHNKDDSTEEFDSIDLRREKIIPSHSTVSVVLAPLVVGKYDFMGEFHSDTARGSIIVQE